MALTVKRIKRIWDKKLLACHLYVVEKCNLQCSYCTEYNNKVPHPSFSTLKKWIDKIYSLGAIRIGIQGGEPLLHPQIVDIVRYIKSRGMHCSVSSNGFLLTPDIVRGLEEAGLDALHISIDRATPSQDTKKCIELVAPKIEYLKSSSIPFHITGVLFKESIKELPQVFDFADSIGSSMKAHLIHAGNKKEFTTDPGEKDKLERFINWEITEKLKGRNIRTPYNILYYQKKLLNGQGADDWTCLAGYKYIFVSAKGKLWTCSMVRTDIDILEITGEMLYKNNKKKNCQEGCGVYCVVVESLVNNNLFKFIAIEMWEGAKGLYPSPIGFSA